MYLRAMPNVFHIYPSGTLGSFAQQFTAEKTGKYGLLDRLLGVWGESTLPLFNTAKTVAVEGGGGCGYNCKSTLYDNVM